MLDIAYPGGFPLPISTEYPVNLHRRENGVVTGVETCRQIFDMMEQAGMAETAGPP
jgi:nicotinate-nucleotide pyrophosphorylase